MKKPDLSKTAMKRFFLLHSEKVVLGIAVALFGLFAWMGYNSPLFNEKTPAELSRMADDADTYILSPTAWDKFKDLRKGNDQAVAIIERAANSIKVEDFQMRPVSGIAIMTRAKRKDPDIYPIIDPHAVLIRTAVIAHDANGVTDPLSDWPLAVASTNVKAKSSSRKSNSKFGKDDSENDKPKQEVFPEVDASAVMHEVNTDTFVGIQPGFHKISSRYNKSKVFNVVIVTGLVDFKQQWSSYDHCFSSGIGYFPNRDRPTYQYLQVQRRELGDDGQPKPDEPGQWADISEDVSYVVPGYYPDMHQLPNSRFPSAPEVTAPENYDPVLTGPIPSIVMFDYRPWVNHPKLAALSRVFPEVKKDDEIEKTSKRGMFDSDPDNENGTSRRGKDSGGDNGGMTMGTIGGMSGKDKKSAGSQFADQTRAGSDMVDYEKAINAKKPMSDYKLVRFFDLKTKTGATYEYRMRIWIADPNQQDPTGSFVSLFGSRTLNEEGNIGNEPGDETGDRPRDRSNETDDKIHRQVDIKRTMLEGTVRMRLEEQTSEVDPNDSTKKLYFVSELRDTGENGQKKFEKIAVPYRPEADDDPSYLRFARPSIWSDTVKISIEEKAPRVAAGATVPARNVKIAGVEFPLGEPVSELVASVWSDDLGTIIPSKRYVYRGDALDFWANAHVLHPITRRVHLAVNPKSTSKGFSKYLVPIKTGNVMVDSMGGSELPLPRAEKKRHHLASEILVMDAFGNFHVQNNMQDSSTFRNRLMLADTSKFVGKDRKKKKDEEDGGTGRGPAGGGLGGGGLGGGGLGGGGLGGGDGPDF